MPLRTLKPASRLTPRQLQLLKAIRLSQLNCGYSPTMGELAEHLSISRSTVFEHIAELRKKGLLRACGGRARSLRLTCEAQNLLEGLGDTGPGSWPNHNEIPLLGRVAAGTPIEAIEQIENLSLDSYFGCGGGVFALEVVGDSMADEDIRDGDYVICKSSSVADNGQLVIAIVDDENATLKRFYREKTRARLQPANDSYGPIYSNNCRIEAVVVGLVRKL